MEKELPSTAEVVLVQALGGVIAGASSSIATTPMDTVKTRLQVCGLRQRLCSVFLCAMSQALNCVTCLFTKPF